MSLNWEQTTKGVYRKPLSHWQTVFAQFGNPAYFGGRENLLPSLCAQLEPRGRLASGDEELIASLKQAWKTLRFEDPGITVTIDGTDAVYYTTEAQPLELWLSSTFGVHEGEEPEEWYGRMTKTTGTELHYFPDSSSVILVSPHWLHDYDGLLMAMHKFFRLLAEPKQETLVWGEEVARLQPNFDELLHFSDPAEPAAKSFVDKMFKDSYDIGHVSGLPVDLSKPFGNSKFARRILSPDSTTSLVEACRAKGITVTTAVHTALALATWELTPSSRQQLPGSICIFRDMRRIVGPPLNSLNHSANCSVCFQIVTFPKTEEFDDVASALQPAYQLTNDEKLKLLAGAKESLDQVIPWLSRPMDPEVPMSTPAISSLGVVEPWMPRDYTGPDSGVHITDLTSLVNIYVPISGSWLFTFHDKLRIMLSYNESTFERSLMDRLLDRVVGILGDNLDVQVVLEDPKWSKAKKCHLKNGSHLINGVH